MVAKFELDTWARTSLPKAFLLFSLLIVDFTKVFTRVFACASFKATLILLYLNTKILEPRVTEIFRDALESHLVTPERALEPVGPPVLCDGPRGSLLFCETLDDEKTAEAQ